MDNRSEKQLLSTSHFSYQLKVDKISSKGNYENNYRSKPKQGR